MNFSTKVCGLTRRADIEQAVALGVDFFGINGWQRSPRFVPAAERRSLFDAAPAGHRVYVDVAPADAALDAPLLDAALAAGADFCQIHFDPFDDGAGERAAAWSRQIGRERLWLAPRVAPDAPWQSWFHELAGTIVFDGHRAGQFGGTGRVADLPRFQKLTAEFTGTRWVLAGGLGAETVVAAWLAGARFFDLNSGVEDAPGIKNAGKLARVLAVLHGLDE